MIGAAQGARMADEYVFYSLDPEVLDQLSLPPVPFPVRQELVGEVFGDERVAVDRVLDELNLYLAQHPEQEDIYREAIGVLAYVVGVTLATEGKEDAAAHCFALGLAHNPDNLSLRTNYALALHNTGREEEALQQYQRIMDDPEVDVSPLVWILAARLHAAGGDDREAYRRLRECAPQVPEGDEFWTFYAEVAERVGEDPNPPGPPPLPGSLSPPLLDEHRPEWYYAQGDQQGGPDHRGGPHGGPRHRQHRPRRPGLASGHGGVAPRRLARIGEQRRRATGVAGARLVPDLRGPVLP